MSMIQKQPSSAGGRGAKVGLNQTTNYVPIQKPKGGAVPSLSNTAGPQKSSASQVMQKYGQPVSQVTQRQHNFIQNDSYPGQSMKQSFQNQNEKAMGYVRDQAGNVMTANDANRAGYHVQPGRYGGNVVNTGQAGYRQAGMQTYNGDDYGNEDDGGDEYGDEIQNPVQPNTSGLGKRQAKKMNKSYNKQVKKNGKAQRRAANPGRGLDIWNGVSSALGSVAKGAKDFM